MDRIVLHMNWPEHLLVSRVERAQRFRWIAQVRKPPSRFLSRLSLFFHLIIGSSSRQPDVVGRRAHPAHGHGDQHKQSDEQKEQQGQARRDKAEETDDIENLA